MILKQTEIIGKTAGVFFIRMLLGGILFYQGFNKLFESGINSIYADLFVSGSSSILPENLIRFSIYTISIIEFAAGFLLIIGLLRNYVLYTLGTIILFILFGFGSTQPVWQSEFIIFEGLLLISLLMLPIEWDKWCMDNLTSLRIK
jgi:uncharacterized membrane protein YphA (DoxX/SURF4 family)